MHDGSFWAYELSKSYVGTGKEAESHAALGTLLCGGIAGVVTWASIFPLDVVKTRLQTRTLTVSPAEEQSLLSGNGSKQMLYPKGAWTIMRETYQEGGIRIFFRGLGVCSARAFVVNAVQVRQYQSPRMDWKADDTSGLYMNGLFAL